VAAAISPMSSMVERMTAILDAFDNSLRRRSLQDIADLAGLATSTAHRILDQLAQSGWVEHDGSGYTLGWRGRNLPGYRDESSLLREMAAPHIRELALRTPFLVHLAVLNGPFVHYLDKVGGPEASRVPSRVGGVLPAHLTAVGKAMLAYLDPEALEVAFEQLEISDRSDLSSLSGELASIRTRGGLSTEKGSPLAAVACVGAPIFGGQGQILGGLSLCDGGTGRALDRFGPALRARTKRISAHLAASAKFIL
jgi:DNA-binding IclR family transcriptional regulator